jgi:hypothetical protein
MCEVLIHISGDPTSAEPTDLPVFGSSTPPEPKWFFRSTVETLSYNVTTGPLSNPGLHELALGTSSSPHDHTI